MKKTKQPGDNISLKTKKSENPAVMDWINAQSNLMDSLRYLIEREIAEHGVRNLQAYIPAERNMLDFIAAPEPLPEQAAAAQPVPALEREPVPVDPKRVPEEEAEEIPLPQETAAEEEIDEEDIAAWI